PYVFTPLVLRYPFLSYCSGDHRYLHSFPTRRSSDLGCRGVRRSWSTLTFCTGYPSRRPTADTLMARSLLLRSTHASARSRRKLRSEEHTSELQSRRDLVCRLVLVNISNVEMTVASYG